MRAARAQGKDRMEVDGGAAAPAAAGGAAAPGGAAAAAAAGGGEFPEEKVAPLVEMGFQRQHALMALRSANGDPELAASLLFGGME